MSTANDLVEKSSESGQVSRRLGETLRIEQRGPTGRSTRIWLNGQELKFIVSLELVITRGGTKAVLTIGVDELDVDAETLLHLRAIHDEQKHGH